MVPTLLTLIPQHKTYVEPFVGGGSLYFAKKPSQVEVINDLNGYVAAFYRVIKNDFDSLNYLIQNTLHDEHTYKQCRLQYRNRYDQIDDLEKAFVLWVGANMSFGGSVFNGSFAITTNSHDRCNPATKLIEKKNRFKTIKGRLEHTMVLEKNAIDVIKKYDSEDTFIYCDPPYLNANQGHYKGYQLTQFKELLDIASSSKSKIMISCYWHDIISRYDNFIIDQKQMTTRIIPTKKTEIIIRNYKVDNGLFNF